MTLINARKYGDFCNNSTLPVQTALKGNMLWEEAAPARANGLGAINLAIKDRLLFALYPGGVVGCKDRKTGKPQWDSEVREGAEFELTSGGILSMGAGSVFVLIDDSGKSIDQIRLPFAGSGHLWALSQVNKEYRYCYALAPRQTNAPSDPVHGPSWSYLRYAPGTNDEFIWELDRPGFIRDVFTTADKSIICVVSDNVFCLIKADGRNDSDVRSITCDEAFCGSFDQGGSLLAVMVETVVDQRKSRRRASLTSFNSESKPTWSYDLPIPPQCPQPPASIDNRSAYMLSGNELLFIEDGRKIWGVDLPCEWKLGSFTVLKDQSVLVSAGISLLHIDRFGNEVKKVLFKEFLTCRPLLDETGKIYVAGRAKVYCLE